jgi:hypothetical protein
MRTALVLDALEQALWARKHRQGLIHHSDSNTERCQVFPGHRQVRGKTHYPVDQSGGQETREPSRHQVFQHSDLTQQQWTLV